MCGERLPHCEDIPSLMKNSAQAALMAEARRFPPNVILATMDIKSLYLNIPQVAGVEMVLQRTHPTIPYTSTENTKKNMLRELLHTILVPHHLSV